MNSICPIFFEKIYWILILTCIWMINTNEMMELIKKKSPTTPSPICICNAYVNTVLEWCVEQLMVMAEVKLLDEWWLRGPGVLWTSQPVSPLSLSSPESSLFKTLLKMPKTRTIFPIHLKKYTICTSAENKLFIDTIKELLLVFIVWPQKMKWVI